MKNGHKVLNVSKWLRGSRGHVRWWTTFLLILPLAIQVKAGQSLHLTSETSQHRQDGLTHKFVQTFMAPELRILSCTTMSLTFVALSKMSQQLLDGLP